MQTKSVVPNVQHFLFRKALEKVISDHGVELDASELCAILSHMVGQVVAMLDQRVYTTEVAMGLVLRNIEVGNKSIVDDLANSANGTPQ